jgi:hypothetical protein
MANNKVSSTGLTSGVIPCSNYVSSLDAGTQIYGVSVVSNISLTEYGESVPTYTSQISTNTTSSNYLTEISWSGTGISNPMFYHVYKRPRLASELIERKLTNVSEINYAPYNTLTTISDNSDFNFDIGYLAAKITPNESFYLGGVTFKAGTLITDSIYNPTENITLGIYGPSTSTPDLTKLISSTSTFRYSDINIGTSNEYTIKFAQGANLTLGNTYWLVMNKTTNVLVGTGTTENLYVRNLPGSTLQTFFSTNGTSWIDQSTTTYLKVRGYLDDGNITGESYRKGIQFTNRIAFTHQRLSVYVPPVENLSYNTGLRYDGSTTGIASTTDSSIKNDLIVYVTARNGESGTPNTVSITVPKGTPRDTRFLLGTSVDLFDRVDDVYIVPGTNLTRNNNGPILWDIYDLITIETVP